MKAQGVWEGVTIALGSEFGRTIDTNGAGTDHGWAGHSFILGGAVRGGQVLGSYPDDLSAASDLRFQRVIVPSMSWESMWHGLAQWLGVSAEHMETVLPNLHHFTNCTGAGCGVLTSEMMFKPAPA